MPSEKEFSTLEHFTEFMKPMVEITEAIGGEKWVTISAIRPVLHKLLGIHLQPSPSDSHAVKQMKEVIRKDLKDRYTSETLDILNKATFLDPRFKGLNFRASCKG